MWVWMWVSKDKYQLPLAVADSAHSLALMTGKTLNTIQSVVSKTEHGVGAKNPPYIRVWIEEDANDICDCGTCNSVCD